jgi:hypothetical protein
LYSIPTLVDDAQYRPTPLLSAEKLDIKDTAGSLRRRTNWLVITEVLACLRKGSVVTLL